MNKISKYLILLKLALFLSSNLFAKDKPNVLFIFADDQCYKTIASLNNEEIIKVLINKGLNMENASEKLKSIPKFN